MSRTIDAPITEPGGPKDTLKPRVYGFSVLVTGFARLFKQPLAFALVIVANAAVQGLLTHWTILTTDTPEFYISAILSGRRWSDGCLHTWWARQRPTGFLDVFPCLLRLLIKKR